HPHDGGQCPALGFCWPVRERPAAIPAARAGEGTESPAGPSERALHYPIPDHRAPERDEPVSPRRARARLLLQIGLGLTIAIGLTLVVFFPQVRGWTAARAEARRKQVELARAVRRVRLDDSPRLVVVDRLALTGTEGGIAAEFSLRALYAR